MDVYTGPPTPTTTTFRPFYKGKNWDQESMLTYLNRKLAKLEKLIEPIWKEEMELKANRTNELPEFYIKLQNKKKKTKDTTDLSEFYIRH